MAILELIEVEAGAMKNDEVEPKNAEVFSLAENIHKS